MGGLFLGWGLHEALGFIATMGGGFLEFGIITLFRVLRITAPRGEH